MQRRTFLQSLAAGTAALALPPFVSPGEEKAKKQTFIYKTVDKCEIKADVYGASDERVRPVVIWIHGGALIMGDRRGMDPVLRDRLIQAGYLVVSIDYRLAPETKLPAILEDVQDAHRWVREKDPALFHAATKNIDVMGGSAGGYLTLTTGYRVEPRPTALVSFWSYGDIAGAWYSRPDSFYRRSPLVSKEEAYQVVGGPVLSEMTGKAKRHRFYLYCRQQGLWPKEVAGLDPDREPKAFDPFCPIRNVSAKYSPTLLVHGTADTDVPYEQSKEMAEELEHKGVEQELLTIAGGGHGLAGIKPAIITQVHERVLAFLNKRLR